MGLFDKPRGHKKPRGSDAVHSMNDGWWWNDPRHGEHFRRCSYCGSIHPEDLVAEPSWRADWADQKYGWPHKFYVNMPNRNPDALFVRGGISGGAHMTDAQLEHEGFVPVSKLTREQKKIMKRDGFGTVDTYKGVQFGTRDSHFGKFYTVHLADPEISKETKETIFKGSGLVIVFKGGKVSWHPYDYGANA